MKHGIFFIRIVCFTTLAFFSACLSVPPTEKSDFSTTTAITTAIPNPIVSTWPIPEGQFLFVEHFVRREGKCALGICGSGKMIDGPTYRYKKESGLLESFISIKYGPALKVILGDGYALGGVFGGGAVTVLYPGEQTPFQREGLTILSAEADGTVQIDLEGQLIPLKPGEEWTVSHQKTISEGLALIEETTQERITNYGILPLTAILTPEMKPTPTIMLLSGYVGQALINPRYIGRVVDIVGYYRGSDVLSEVDGDAPVSADDWVIVDSSGAIYVQGGLPILGGEDLDLTSSEDAYRLVHVRGTVRSTPQGMHYIEPIEVEVVHEE